MAKESLHDIYPNGPLVGLTAAVGGGEPDHGRRTAVFAGVRG